MLLVQLSAVSLSSIIADYLPALSNMLGCLKFDSIFCVSVFINRSIVRKYHLYPKKKRVSYKNKKNINNRNI